MMFEQKPNCPTCSQMFQRCDTSQFGLSLGDHVLGFVQVSSLLGGTLGFGVKRADIPGLQRHLLDLDPYDDPLNEEFWETVCLSRCLIVTIVTFGVY